MERSVELKVARAASERKSENMNKTPRLERAIAIRSRALQIIEAKGQWEKTA
jgi:hypothetical protein